MAMIAMTTKSSMSVKPLQNRSVPSKQLRSREFDFIQRTCVFHLAQDQFDHAYQKSPTRKHWNAVRWRVASGTISPDLCCAGSQAGLAGAEKDRTNSISDSLLRIAWRDVT